MFMDYEELQNNYKALKKENDDLRYHMKLMLMMLPKTTQYEFFEYVITCNISELEMNKILKVLSKIESRLKNKDIPESIYTVNGEKILFDITVPEEKLGEQFANYMNELFEPSRNIHLGYNGISYRRQFRQNAKMLCPGRNQGNRLRRSNHS